MSTLTPSRNEPATVQSSRGFRIGDAMNYQAWIAKAAKQPMVLETFDLGPFGAEDVEVAVEHCGLCHSDLSVLNNDWGISQYPAILGHEVIGRVTAVGPNAKRLKVGQRVGIGWRSIRGNFSSKEVSHGVSWNCLWMAVSHKCKSIAKGGLKCHSQKSMFWRVDMTSRALAKYPGLFRMH